jgi:hypothetical protein
MSFAGSNPGMAAEVWTNEIEAGVARFCGLILFSTAVGYRISSEN